MVEPFYHNPIEFTMIKKGDHRFDFPWQLEHLFVNMHPDI